jgi:cobalt/nickel transport system permease protein
MHLADGTIPIIQAAAYGATSAAFVAVGIKRNYQKLKSKLDYKIMCGVFVAFVFIVTVFEIPVPFMGTTEHPTGTPLMAIFIGPWMTPLLSAIVLTLELMFRDGGITTLGANVFSLGIVGGFAGWGIFFLLRKLKIGMFIAGFIAGFIGDLSVYLTTALQLSIAHYEGKSFLIYFMTFVPVQVPLAIIEGLFTGLVLQFIFKRRPEMLKEYRVID